MSKVTTSSRRQRRLDLKRANMLKIKNTFGFFTPQRTAWRSKMAADGKQAFEAYSNKVNDSIGDQLQSKVNELKKTWESIGYNDTEISMLEEAFSISSIKNKSTLREDKRAAKELMKSAKASMQQRSK